MPKVPISKPAITNRGAAGLLRKLTDEEREALHQAQAAEGLAPKPVAKLEAKHHIAPALQALAVPIEGLILDPENARLHPERNLAAIKASLLAYGQRKNIVVNRKTMIVEAGNGTLEAAKALGWTEIAVAFIDDEPLEAAGYGLADNRTSELATWDLKVMARIDKLLQAAGQESIGWTQDELDVLRAAAWDWLPPTVDDASFGGGENGEGDKLLVSFTAEQHLPVTMALAHLQAQFGDLKLEQGEALEMICREWLAINGLPLDEPKNGESETQADA